MLDVAIDRWMDGCSNRITNGWIDGKKDKLMMNRQIDRCN